MAQIKPRRFKQPRSQYPLFYRVDVQPDVISVEVYERLVKKVGTDILIGEVSREEVLPHDATAKEQTPDTAAIYASSLTENRRGRVAIDGEKVDPSLKDTQVVHLGTSRLFNQRIAEGDKRVNLGSWEVADCITYGIFVDRRGYPMPPITITEEHVNRKANTYRAAEARDAAPAVLVFRPFAGDDFTKCSVTVRSHPTLGFASNVEEWEDLDYQCLLEPLVLPSVRVENEKTIAPNGVATVAIKVVNEETDEVLDANCELFLEESGGYLPQRRVKITNGHGQFKVQALGLEPGEKFKVKVGFRLVTGLADAHFEVK